jgi:hypothetical protein
MFIFHVPTPDVGLGGTLFCVSFVNANAMASISPNYFLYHSLLCSIDLNIFLFEVFQLSFLCMYTIFFNLFVYFMDMVDRFN